MKNLFAVVAIATSVFIAGCGAGGSEMTKEEEKALTNPSKTIPPEAIEGMRRQGELQRKQMEANAAAGVDSRGVPLSKSKEAGGAPPPPAGGQ